MAYGCKVFIIKYLSIYLSIGNDMKSKIYYILIRDAEKENHFSMFNNNY